MASLSDFKVSLRFIGDMMKDVICVNLRGARALLVKLKAVS